MSEIGVRLDLRDQPPVEPLEDRPERYSQTFLRHYDACRRSAYLYLKYRGGASSHPLDRGTAFHRIAELGLNMALVEGELPDWQTMIGVSESVFKDRTLQLPRKERDDIREMVYHWCEGYRVDPSSVVGVERMFAAEVAGVWVAGKVDVAWLKEDHAGVDDYKTSFDAQSEGEYADAFQAWLYAWLLMFGQPVIDWPAGGEPDLLPSFGGGLVGVWTRELYPRFRLGETGELVKRENWLSRQQLVEFGWDLESMVLDVQEGMADWKWPAVQGPHCSVCPAMAECPLPPRLIERWVPIEEDGDAELVAARSEWLKAEGKNTNALLRKYVRSHGPLIFGGGTMVAEIVPVESWKTEWEALEQGVGRAVEFGEEFELSMVRRRSVSMRLVVRALKAEEKEQRRGIRTRDEDGGGGGDALEGACQDDRQGAGDGDGKQGPGS